MMGLNTMKKLNSVITLLIITSSIVISQTLRIVDKWGSPGSYPTITDAVNESQPGDTIKVLSGTYTESVNVGKKLFIIAQDSTVEVVSGTNAFTFYNGSSGSLLYGFTLKGHVYHPRNFEQTEPIVIANNRFINTYVDFMNWTIIANNYFLKASLGNGINTYGSNASDKRIIVFNNTLDSCGIKLTGNHTSIIANKINNYSEYGILSYDALNDFQIIANRINNCGCGICLYGWQSKTNFTVSNNLITNCPIGLHYNYGPSLFTGVISNNIVYNSTVTAVLYHDGLWEGSSVYFYSNIFLNNTGNISFPASVWDYNCFYNSGSVPTPGIGNINADPLFVNVVNGNFQLQSSSPCINTGHPNLIYSDIDRTRNDIGIYGGSHTMSNYENLLAPKVISLFMSPTQVIKGSDIIITGSGIAK